MKIIEKMKMLVSLQSNIASIVYIGKMEDISSWNVFDSVNIII